MVAMGCTEIAMGPRAEFGDFEPLLQQRGGGRPRERFNMLQESLVGLAHEQGYSELAMRGMLDPDLVIYRVHSQKGAAQWKLVTEAELATDQAGPHKWDEKSKMLIKPAGRLLKLDANMARELGFVRHIVPNEQELYQIYGLKKVRDISFDFLYELATFPALSAGLDRAHHGWRYRPDPRAQDARRQLPGNRGCALLRSLFLGPVAACRPNHHVGHLALHPGPDPNCPGNLRVAWLRHGRHQRYRFGGCQPGAGDVGKTAPETSTEWMSFGRTLGGVGVGLLGAMGLAGIAAWYLPNIPYANRLVLRPPQELDDEEQTGAEGTPGHIASLLGAIGAAATTLRPAGIARFGDRFVDVVSEGSLIEMGSRVQVVEIEGNRIVVKEI